MTHGQLAADDVRSQFEELAAELNAAWLIDVRQALADGSYRDEADFRARPPAGQARTSH